VGVGEAGSLVLLLLSTVITAAAAHPSFTVLLLLKLAVPWCGCANGAI
jgi:hypothetical protein